jgi:hypothetical protein
MLTNLDVANLFVSQIENHGNNKNNSLFFYNDSIYSYGTHFCIAKLIDSDTLLFTIDKYSNATYRRATNNHISVVAKATNHMNKIYCYDPRGSHYGNFEHWIELSEEILSKLQRAKKPKKYIIQLQDIKKQVDKYASYFKVSVPTLLDSALSVTQS